LKAKSNKSLAPERGLFYFALVVVLASLEKARQNATQKIRGKIKGVYYALVFNLFVVYSWLVYLSIR
jgi:hypothetical protein